MSKEEAIEWINGERSSVNIVPLDPYETWQARIAQADAEKIKAAYYVLKAHKEELI